MADDIKDKINEIAERGIKRTKVDASEVEQMSIDDLIKAHRFEAETGALTTNKVAKIRALSMRAKFPGGNGNA